MCVKRIPELFTRNGKGLTAKGVKLQYFFYFSLLLGVFSNNKCIFMSYECTTSRIRIENRIKEEPVVPKLRQPFSVDLDNKSPNVAPNWRVKILVESSIGNCT